MAICLFAYPKIGLRYSYYALFQFCVLIFLNIFKKLWVFKNIKYYIISLLIHTYIINTYTIIKHHAYLCIQIRLHL